MLPTRPMIISHRGACGRLPEQTLAAFELAIEQAADAIELDVVSTKDGVLVARHECELSLTTDVASHPEFAGRRTTKVIDGAAVAGWFVEDFTAAELRQLRSRQRLAFRGTQHDGLYPIPTLAQVLELVAKQSRPTGRRPAIFIEIKHPTYFDKLGLKLADLLLRTLDDHGIRGRDGGVYLQSFEIGILKGLRECTELPIIQLLDAPAERPFDLQQDRSPLTYRDMIAPQGLRQIASYADGIGPWKRLIVPASHNQPDAPEGQASRLSAPTTLIEDAHAAGLFVCAWTFRDEPQYLAADYENDPKRQYEQFYRLGIDGVITDFPETALVAAQAGSWRSPVPGGFPGGPCDRGTPGYRARNG